MIRVAIKDLRLFFKDKRGMMLTFLLPIVLISLFATIFEGRGSRVDRPKFLVVVDEDRTDVSKKIIADLDSLKEFEVRVTTLDTAQRWIMKGEEASALILHQGLKDSLEHGDRAPFELQHDAAREAEVGLLQAALIGKLMRIVGAKSFEKNAIASFDAQNPGLDSATRKDVHKQIDENFSSGSKEGGTSLLKTTALVAEKENSPGLVQSVAGTSLMMLLFTVASLGASILDEKQEGTLKRLLYSPISPYSILIGKMLSTNTICIIQLSIMFTFAWIVFGLNILQNIPSLILMIFASGFACSGFGVFLASFSKTRSQVQGLATLIILVMSAIGGSMVPIFLMPPFMQKLAGFSVNYWGIQGFYDIFWRMLPISDLTFLSRVAVLFGIGLFLNIIAIKMFRRNVLAMA